MIGTLKHSALRILAAAICRLPPLAPLRRSLLLEWRFIGSTPKGRVRDALFHHVLEYWFEHVYRREPDADRRETMKLEIMGHRSADWIASYGEQAPDALKRRLLEGLDASLSTTPAALVVEIGAGSGKDIAWLAGRHPRHTFVGTEPFTAGVDYARARFHLPNLRFAAATAQDAPRFLDDGAGYAHRYVVALGVLAYMQPEHLQRLLAELARVRDLDLLAREPYHGSPDAPASRFRANFSWTHPYRRYGEAAGLVTRSFEIGEQIFYWGTTTR